MVPAVNTHSWEVFPLFLGLAGGSCLCMRDVEVTMPCLCLCASVPSWKGRRMLKAHSCCWEMAQVSWVTATDHGQLREGKTCEQEHPQGGQGAGGWVPRVC